MQRLFLAHKGILSELFHAVLCSTAVHSHKHIHNCLQAVLTSELAPFGLGFACVFTHFSLNLGQFVPG